MAGGQVVFGTPKPKGAPALPSSEERTTMADVSNIEQDWENAVLDDKDLQAGLMKIDPEFGEFCIRVSGEVFGKPLIDQKTKAMIAIAVDVVEQIRGIPFENHVEIAMEQGATPEELKELLFLMTIYAGLNKAGGMYGDLDRVMKKVEKKHQQK